jgi:hypothetical protein
VLDVRLVDLDESGAGHSSSTALVARLSPPRHRPSARTVSGHRSTEEATPTAGCATVRVALPRASDRRPSLLRPGRAPDRGTTHLVSRRMSSTPRQILVAG